MVTIVIYDIESDSVRRRVAEACLDYGLHRIQYSAFRGDLNHNRRQELLLRIRGLLEEEDTEANVQFYPLCHKDMKLSRELEYPLDRDAKERSSGW